MSRRRDPSVISPAMLLAGIEDDDADPHSAVHVHSIVKIENLQTLRNVSKLRLDNNMIANIEGLECLPNLTWLDLSFNNISVIKGLHTLTKLTDLTLYANRIEVIEGLDALKEMQVLSLGNNTIKDLNQVLRLRSLPKLKVVTLEGNPISQGNRDLYKSYCLTFLPQLQYFDYALVTAADLKAARESAANFEEIIAAEEIANAQQREADKSAAKKALMARLTSANLEVCELLIAELMEDEESQRYLTIPGWRDNVDSCSHIITQAAENLKEQGLMVSQNMETETANFKEARRQAQITCNERAAATIAAWETAFAKCARNVHMDVWHESQVPSASHVDFLQLLTHLDEVHKSLVKDEVQLHAQILAMTDMFDTAVREQCAAKQSMLDGFYRVVETSENAMYTSLLKLVESIVQMHNPKAMKDTADIDEDVLALLHDKESVLSSITASHEMRVRKISEWERETKVREDTKCKRTVQDAEDDEHARNRDRMAEIHDWVDRSRERVSDMQTGIQNLMDRARHGVRNTRGLQGASMTPA